MAERQAAPHRFTGKSGSVRVWAPWLIGPLSWAAHQTLTYWLSATACDPGALWLFVAATALGVAATAGGAALGWAAWRPVAPVGERSLRIRFLSGLGALICVASAVGILTESIPFLVLDPCGGIP